MTILQMDEEYARHHDDWLIHKDKDSCLMIRHLPDSAFALTRYEMLNGFPIAGSNLVVGTLQECHDTVQKEVINAV